MKYLFLLSPLFLLSCTTPEQRKAAADGAVAGGKEFVGAVGDAFSALETGGWTAAALVLIAGAVKATMKGLQVSKSRRVAEVAEGVKAARK